MTDERIKEEFDKTKGDARYMVSASYQEIIKDRHPVDKAAMVGFYVGVKAAERLAKIEVLENILNDVFWGTKECEACLHRVEEKLAELKGEQ